MTPEEQAAEIVRHGQLEATAWEPIVAAEIAAAIRAAVRQERLALLRFFEKVSAQLGGGDISAGVHALRCGEKSNREPARR